MPAKSDGTSSAPRTLVTHPELRSHHSFPLFRTIGEAPKSPLERFLSLFADVRAGEGVGVILLAVNIFLLLSGYYWLRSAREALILTDGTLFGLKGPQLAAASAGGQALLLLGVVPFYGWLASRVPRMRLIGMTSIFFAANLLLFYLGGQAGLREGVVFFIWLGIYNVFIVAQFWAFANDLYTEGQGRRLFPLIGVGMSLGAVAGAATVKPLVERFEVTPYTLMVGAAVLILVALVLTLIVNRRESGRAEPSQAAVGQDAARSRGRLRAGAQGSLSDVDRGAHDPAQRREHHRRISAAEPGLRSSLHGCPASSGSRNSSCSSTARSMPASVFSAWCCRCS